MGLIIREKIAFLNSCVGAHLCRSYQAVQIIPWKARLASSLKRNVTFMVLFFSLIDRRGFVVADPPPASVVVQKSEESNAVNKVWHESYGATTVTQPQVGRNTEIFKPIQMLHQIELDRKQIPCDVW